MGGCEVDLMQETSRRGTWEGEGGELGEGQPVPLFTRTPWYRHANDGSL